MSTHDEGFFHRLDGSAILTIIGVILLFSSAIIVTVIAPALVDPSWIEPTSHYQVQMYEVADAQFYMARPSPTSQDQEYVYHLKKDHSLVAFQESPVMRIIAPGELEQYVTREGEQTLKLTTQPLLLRTPKQAVSEGAFDAVVEAEKLQKTLQKAWEERHPDWEEKKLQPTHYKILELYNPGLDEIFALGRTDGVFENYVDQHFVILDANTAVPHHSDPGVIYVLNPEEYRIKRFSFGQSKGYRFDPEGVAIKDLKELTSEELGFRSRKELIALGEHLFAIEGCWYCHTDQSRTLIQDCVLNGSESYAAPPSSANEYIYQKISFAGTRRIGPDLARVGVKRPSRDWHKGHFWSPKTASEGTIMPAFRHFFDDDPRGTRVAAIGVPNYKFEAMFQYLMTKGTRITPPTQAWWLGKDPVRTTEIIQGER